MTADLRVALLRAYTGRLAGQCGAETFHTSTGLLGRCTLPKGHQGAHSAVGPW